MAEINIDRMTVTAASLSTDDGKRLARLIAEKIAAHSQDVQASVQRPTVNVSASAGTGLDRLAETIVGDIIRQLNRSI